MASAESCANNVTRYGPAKSSIRSCHKFCRSGKAIKRGVQEPLLQLDIQDSLYSDQLMNTKNKAHAPTTVVQS